MTRTLRYLALTAMAVTATIVTVPAFADSGTSAAECSAIKSNGFAHFHASGMWSMGIEADHSSKIDANMSVAQERTRLRQQAKTFRADASIVTHTESDKPAHWDAIRKDAGPCWKAYPAKAAEETVEWNTRRWTAKERDRVLLTKVSNRNITATIVRLEETAAPSGRDKRQVVMMVSHLPAGVEADWSKGTARVERHKDAMKALQKLVKKYNKAFPKATIIVSGDWNLNHKAKFKGVINKHLEGAGYNIRSAWTSENTGHSLYGSNRLIDGDWYVNAKRCGAYVKDVKKANAASDHIPYRVRYAFGDNC